MFSTRFARTITPAVVPAAALSFVLNDAAGQVRRGNYIEAVHIVATGTTIANEVQVGNYSSTTPIANAYSMGTSVVNGFRLGVENHTGYTLGSGGIPLGNPTRASGAAIWIDGGSGGFTYQKWTAGIVVFDNSIVRDGSSFGTAVSLAQKHKIEWQATSSIKGAAIWSEVSINLQQVGISFHNQYVKLVGYNNRTIVEAMDDITGAGAVNWITLKNSGTAIPLEIAANGSNLNISLNLVPKGTGSITAPTRIGTDSTTALATTEFVKNQNYITMGSISGVYLPVSNPAFTGTLTGPTVTVTGVITTTGGGITIERSGDAAAAYFTIQNDDGYQAGILLRTDTRNRWLLYKNTDAESGSNAGSNLGLYAYDDIGNGLGAIFTVARATRVMAFGVTPTAPTQPAGTNTTELATTAFVTTAMIGAGAGSVMSVAVVSANGLAGTVANPTTTASITLSTTITGILKGNGTAISAAVANTDYLAVTNPTFTGTLTGPSITTTGNITTTNGSIIVDRTGDAATAPLDIRSDATFAAAVYFQTGPSTRWYMGKGGTAETGSNAGSEFGLVAMADNGSTIIGSVFTIIRSTRILTFAVTPHAPTMVGTDNSTSVATTEFVKAQNYLTAGAGGTLYLPINNPGFTGTLTGPAITIAGNITTTAGMLIVDRGGDLTTAGLYLRSDTAVPSVAYFTTGTSIRWHMGKDSTAELGLNAGSNFVLFATADNGTTAIGSVFTAIRSSRIVSFAVSPIAPTPIGTDDSTKLATTEFVKDQNYLTAGDGAGLYQPLDSTLTGLAALNTTVGLVEQTGTNVFTKRAIGVAAGTSVLTRADGDGRYSLLAHTHTASQITDFAEATDDRVAALLVAGANVTVSYNDTLNTITIASTASGGGGGTVTSVSVVSGNGFAGSVGSPTTTPAITLSTTISSMLKGNGTAISAAVAGTDYLTPAALTGLMDDYLPLAGGTMTGNLITTAGNTTIQGGYLMVDRSTDATAAAIYVRADNSQTAATYYGMPGENRWSIGKNADAESTGNLGSNFLLYAYDDDGAALGTVFTVARSTRIVAFALAPTVPTLAASDDSTSVATTAFVKDQLYITAGDGATLYLPIANPGFTGTLTGAAITVTGLITTTGGNILIDRAGDAVNSAFYLRADAGFYAITYYQTGPQTRWWMGKNATAETLGGSNSGSDFSLSCYADDGTTAIGEVFRATRATRVVHFYVTPSTVTPATSDNNQNIATTAYVKAQGYTSNTGTVTTLSVVSANGFAGTVATATSTPAITLTTTITGILKGNATAISAAVANTDYLAVASPTFTGTLTGPTATFSGILTAGHGSEILGTSTTLLHVSSAAAGQQAAIVFHSTTGTTGNRWFLGKNSNAEGGGDVGSDFMLFAYSNTGTNIGTVFTAARATRIVAFVFTPTAPTMISSDDSTSLATTAFVKDQNYITMGDTSTVYLPLSGGTLTGPLTGTTSSFTNVTASIAISTPLLTTTANLVLNAATANRIYFRINNVSQMEMQAAVLYPTVNDTMTLGTAGLRWANISSVLGNFSGNIIATTASFSDVTFSGVITGTLITLTHPITVTSGTINQVNQVANIAPTGASTTVVRSYAASNSVSGTFAVGTDYGYYSEGTRFQASSNMSLTIGAYCIGLTLPAASVNFGTITDVEGGRFGGVSSFTNTATGTVTNIRGIHVITSSKTSATYTNHAGIVIAAITNATNNTHLVVGSGSIPAGQWGIYNSSSSNNAFSGNTRFGGVTAPVATVDVTGTITATGAITGAAGTFSGIVSGSSFSTAGEIRTTGSNILSTGGSIYVSRIGDAAIASMTIEGDAGFASQLLFNSTNNRWLIGKNGTAEGTPGTNVGSDFLLYAYNDDGTGLGTVFSVVRATRITTFSAQVVTVASGTTGAGFRINHGTAPTTPGNGDMWTTTAGLFVRINGVTKTVTTT